MQLSTNITMNNIGTPEKHHTQNVHSLREGK